MKYLIIAVVLLSGCASCERALEYQERCGSQLAWCRQTLSEWEGREVLYKACDKAYTDCDENRFIEAGKRAVEQMQKAEGKP